MPKKPCSWQGDFALAKETLPLARRFCSCQRNFALGKGKIFLPRAKSLCQESSFLAKSKMFLPRAKFLCQEQNLFAKRKISLPRVKSLCQEQILFSKSKISLPRAKSLCQEQSFFGKSKISLRSASTGYTWYEWVVARAGGDRDRVLVWGHSLGTGVAGHLVSLLSQEGISPTGLVLESPFNNIFDEVRNHPMCWVWSKMPWFDWFFTKSLADNDVGFVTDQRIALIDCPVLILHAEDDAVVPYKLGVALYETAQSCRSPDWGPVQLQSYPSDLGYGHKYICRDPGLPQLIRDFLEKCRIC